jgi:PTS system fructose-specific IIC component
MKTLLIIDAGLGQARAYMAKTLLGTAAHKAHLELIDNPNDAELAIVLGTALPADSALNGKQVFLGDINRAVAHPELFLSEAKGHATPYAAPAAATLPAAAGGENASWRSPPARPALRIPLWRQKPLKPKPKNAAGG